MAPDNYSTKTYPVPALEKGLKILEALSNANVPQSLTDLSRTLNRSTSELFRMVDCLERTGYIIRDHLSGSYYLSLKLYQLAHTHSPVEQLLRTARQPMRELSYRIRQSCHLSILNGEHLIVLAQEESPEKIRVSVEVGGTYSPIETVSGRTLLARMTKDELVGYLAQNLYYLNASKEEKKTLMTQLDEIRSIGYATAINETYLGVQDFSVIVGNPEIGVCAALAVNILISTKNNTEKEIVVEALLECARQITDRLGLNSFDWASVHQL